jgi:gamma-D-glutamyl-L-lysine dipeptidyl-peptidase
MAKAKKIDTKLWMHGICHLSVIPIMSKPLHDGQMITQLLFGEVFTIVEKKNKLWNKIMTQDQVIGWIFTPHITFVPEALYFTLQQSSGIALEVAHPIFHDDLSKMIVLGSYLPSFNGMRCIMPDGNYIYNGQGMEHDMNINREVFVKIARRYLFTPELRGGKSPFGIDSSALIQMIFRHACFLYRQSRANPCGTLSR